MSRKVSFEEAKAKFTRRYTCEHVPAWANKPLNGRYYAPHYRSDKEWYDSTVFPGEPGVHGNCKHAISKGQTWPCGSWLDAPFSRLAAGVTA